MKQFKLEYTLREALVFFTLLALGGFQAYTLHSLNSTKDDFKAFAQRVVMAFQTIQR